ncbi:MAG: NUDIX domain-containing protein [Nanoarchaeota archaeon]
MPDELIDIFDENNQLTGKQLLKSFAHKKGLWHRAAHIWIYNSRGEILLQLRQKGKVFYPDRWDISAAGHVSAGEEPIVSGLRELEEELGLKVKKKDLEFLKIRKVIIRFRKIINKEFYYIYLLRYDGQAENLRIQDSELQEIRFWTPQEIKKELHLHPRKFVPHGKYWMDIIGEIKKRVD